MNYRPWFSTARLFGLTLGLAFSAQTVAQGSIVINEVLAKNTFSSVDEDGDASDWVELLNAGEETVELNGYRLSDRADEPAGWSFPSIRLSPGEFLLVWCSGKDRRGPQATELHTSFRVSAGESIFLWSEEGNLVRQIELPKTQTEDHSFGFRDGDRATPTFFLWPTPGERNDAPSSEDWISDRPLFSPSPGVHVGPVDVRISWEQMPFDDVLIRFTMDGTEPNAESPRFDPEVTVRQNVNLVAAGFYEGRRVTRSAAASYLPDARDLRLPIISLSMAPTDFEWVHNASGRGRNFERPLHMEVLGEAGQVELEVGAGLRLHGGGGRSGTFDTKKAYRLYFRSEYGNGRLESPFFADSTVSSFDRLVLRAGFNDAFRAANDATLLRDQIVRDLHGSMGQLAAQGTWFHLFVNSRHRGLYNLTERIDGRFLSDHLSPGESTEWDIVRNGGSDDTFELAEGTLDEWLRTLEFFSDPESEAEDFDTAARMLDIESLTTYVVLHLWAQNLDWPLNNWFAVRERRKGARWRFLTWDSEVTMQAEVGPFQEDSLQTALRHSDAPLMVFFSRLLRSERYQRFLIAELDRRLGSVLHAENVLATIDRHAAALAEDIPEEIDAALAGVAPGMRPDVDTWRRSVESLRSFARERNEKFRNFFVRSPQLTLPRAQRAEPSSVEPRGEVTIGLRGVGYSPETEVFFNDLPSPVVTFVSERRIDAVLPYELALDGEPSITIASPGEERFTSKNLLSVRFPRPELESVTPQVIPASGGELLEIRGRGFVSGLRVEFDGQRVPVLGVFDEGSSIRLQAPARPPGNARLSVINTRPGELPSTNVLEVEFRGFPAFVRGDTDQNQRVDLSDAVRVLRFLFRSGDLDCRSTADTDDDGSITLSDAISILNYLFQGGEPPVAPFPSCGTDATQDELGCGTSLPCE
ncbi:MAG: CotH kinase family protein [Planctomycetota bacterium]